MLINSEYFTEFSRQWDNGYYNKLHPKSLEYQELWQEQYNRCVNGYTVGGKWMSGRLYSYINFGTIQLIEEGYTRKSAGRPLLRDVEWIVFSYLEEAIHRGQGFAWISGRRGGKSYIASWLAVYDFTFFPHSSTVISAGDADKAYDCMLKAKFHLQGLQKTEFGWLLSKENIKDEIRSGWREKNSEGQWVDKQTDRVIYNRNFNKTDTAANGLTANVFVFEEIGMFDRLLPAYNSAEPCWKEGTKNFGFPFLCGTGGDMDKGSIDAAKMFDNPETYNLFAFYDDMKSEEHFYIDVPELPYKLNRNSENKTGFFLPGYMVLNDFKDENGNTKIEEAKEALLKRREIKKKGKDLKAMLSEIQYYPFDVEEAFLVGASNIFPIALLQDHMKNIMLSKDLKNIGIKSTLGIDENKVVYSIPGEDLIQVEFPVKKGIKQDGCVVIYEYPFKIDPDTQEIPKHLYVIGVDPYAQDAAETSTSMGAAYVYKRFFDNKTTSDIIAAEYVGRPQTADIFYENVRLLALYYNAKILYENNIPGLKQYFERKNSLSLLCQQPELVTEIAQDSTVVKRSHGINMSEKMKLHLINVINTWLLTPRDPENEIYNLHTIYSLPLLKELVNFSFEKGNFDRIIAFGIALIQDQEYFKINVKKILEPKLNLFSDLDQYYKWGIR